MGPVYVPVRSGMTGGAIVASIPGADEGVCAGAGDVHPQAMTARTTIRIHRTDLILQDIRPMDDKRDEIAVAGKKK
jgi:hypothetical protein